MTPITIIKVQYRTGTYFIERSLDAYNVVENKTITLVAHEIHENPEAKGIYCLFMKSLAELESWYRGSAESNIMNFAEFLYNNADVRVEK